MEKLKFKYLYLNPSVYIKCGSDKCLIYNPENAKYIFVEDTYKVKILKRLYDYSNHNFYATKLSEEEFTGISGLIEKLSKSSIGGIIERDEDEKQPVIVPPVIRVSHQLGNYSTDSLEYLQDIKSYIYNLYINLNTEIGNVREKYFDSYKQFESPKYSLEKKSLDFITLKESIENINYPPTKIILSGGNIFDYSALQELSLYLFEKFPETVISFVCDIEDYVKNKAFFRQFENNNFYIKVTIDMATFNNSELLQNVNNKQIIFNFIITNNSEMTAAINIGEDNKLIAWSLLPYYNGKNLEFFRENIFIEKEDILTKQDSLSIASKSVINKQLFGNIYIAETGEIKLNPNSKSIGNIKNDNLYLCINNAFATKQHYPWFLTRENVLPCKHCVFSQLCPSISNYELFLNKFDFCKINNDD